METPSQLVKNEISILNNTQKKKGAKTAPLGVLFGCP